MDSEWQDHHNANYGPEDIPAQDYGSLIERLEKADGPSVELDCLIFEGQHRLLTPERRGTYYGEPTGEYFDLDGVRLPERAPKYTASLDAALTLVPDGHRWKCGYSKHVPHFAEVVDYENHRGTFVGETDGNRALAICIAALKARSVA